MYQCDLMTHLKLILSDTIALLFSSYKTYQIDIMKNVYFGIFSQTLMKSYLRTQFVSKIIIIMG